MRVLRRVALALPLACALPDVLPQSIPAPAPAAAEPVPNEKPRGIYATIDTSRTNSEIRQLGQLIPTPRRDAIAAAVADAPRLAPPALYALANAVALDDAYMTNAVFWYHVARIRAVYDALRCRDATARGVVNDFGKRVNPDISRYQRQHREQTLQIAGLALKWDREHPHDYDHRWINLYGKVVRYSEGTDPAELTVPESEWPAILQHVHEAHLKSVEEFATQK